MAAPVEDRARLADPADRIILDDRIRGVPPGVAAFDSGGIAAKRWHPAAGAMALPVLTLDEAAYCANRDLVMRYVRENGIDIAPHAKTPMSTDLARDLVEAGAWATTVADVRQAAVMARAGLSRLLLANEVGGSGGARRLLGFAAACPATKIFCFVDSAAGVAALAEAWRAAPGLPPLSVLVDVGCGRAGTRTLAEAEAVADAVMAAQGALLLAGVGAYEGNAIQPEPEGTARAMDDLLARTGAMFAKLRQMLGPGPELVLTAGGSLFFDRIAGSLRPLVQRDGNARLVLRSGAIFFYDHGICERFLGALGQGECLGGPLVPALRLWAEVLSRPEPGLALCGLGMRDVSFDQGFPSVLRVHRGGAPLPAKSDTLTVTRLNDQHCFLRVPDGSDLAVGDVVEFGVTHACTSIDRHQVIYGLDGEGYVRHAFPTRFG